MKMRINEIKKLYHGTDKKFRIFDFEKAGKAKDFGRGFYLTSSIVQAQEWAQKKGRKNKIAYIYTYQLNCVEPEKWKILELLEYDKKWLEYITKNRMEAHEDDYDIVYDRMADKRYPDLTNAIEALVLCQDLVQIKMRSSAC